MSRAELTAYAELHNLGVRTGDFEPMLQPFAPDADLRFLTIDAGPVRGREAIRSAFAANPPDDTLTMLGDPRETADGASASAHDAGACGAPHRRCAAPRSDEYHRQARTPRRTGPVRGQRVDAHRGMGRQHGHPILGVRAFRSQLLCEQVVGRGLRRRSSAANDDGFFETEYANVYGIAFQFISSDRPTADPRPPRPAGEVCAVEGREDLRITFPRLDGYRVEIPGEQIWLDTDGAPVFEIGPNTVPRWVEVEGVASWSSTGTCTPRSRTTTSALPFPTCTRAVRTPTCLTSSSASFPKAATWSGR